jgi:thiamine biosynthesis protein ThiI
VKQSQILIRYGEIGLKAEATRRRFSNALRKQIKRACNIEGIPANIEVQRGRFFLHTEHIDKASEILSKIFGVVSFSPVWETSSQLEMLTDDVVCLLSEKLNRETSFALRVRRSGNHKYSSQDAAVQIGNSVCNKFHSSVDLEDPDVELFIEIRDEKAYLFLEKLAGVGGLPYATQGTVCCYVKDKSDIIASWFLMKRGCSIYFVSSTESLLEQLKLFLNKWYIPVEPVFFPDSPSEKIQMFLGNIIKKYRCEALCTGYRCKKKDKELLTNIEQLQYTYSVPVLTPLISFSDQKYEQLTELLG